ncbi:MAG: ribonuclease P protein component [Deltaproteobacteria bacterium]|nr:ribonuclease P protein component [Deltaproteobacteria bacterium]
MSLSGSERFPKTARLRKRPQFLQLSRTGSKFQSVNFVVISRVNDGAESRLGITVSGKVGNSVVRNRIKRQVREFFRRRRGSLPLAADYLVIARNGAATLANHLIAGELERAFSNQRSRRKA